MSDQTAQTKEKELTYEEKTLTGGTVKRSLKARLSGLFDWAGTKKRLGRSGHIEITQSFYCKCGKAVNVRDRRAKRYHQGKGHGPA